MILDGLRDIQTTRYAQLASSSIIVYDHVVTFDQEVELIWSSSWSAGKVLFLINRYYSLFSVIFNNYGFFSTTLSDSFCLHFFKWQGWTGLIACIIAEMILQMRIYAMYSLNKKVLICMVISFIASISTSAWIMGTVVGSVNAKAIKIPGGTFCMPGTVQTNFFIFWIPMLAFECLLCGLALFRGFQTFRSEGTLYQNGRHLVGILIRDSILYFLVICTTYTTCLLVWIIGPTSLLEVPVGFSVAMSCVLANRVVFNVREVNRDIGRSENTSQQAMGKQQATWASFCSPGCLTQFEIDQLRSMRVELDGADLEDYSVDLPFVVL